MGLHFVEIIMEIEEHLEIEIPDEIAYELRTVGDLKELAVNFVALKNGYATNTPCVSMVAFNRLRQGLLRASNNCPRSEIRPDATVRDLIPNTNLSEIWNRFTSHCDLKLPRLEADAGRIFWIIMGLTAAFYTGWLLLFTETAYYILPSLILWPLVAVALSTLLALGPSLKAIPLGCEDMRGLVKNTLISNPELIADDLRAMPRSTRHAIEETVVNVLVEQMNLDRAEVVDSANIYKDLGLG